MGNPKNNRNESTFKVHQRQIIYLVGFYIIFCLAYVALAIMAGIQIIEELWIQYSKSIRFSLQNLRKTNAKLSEK